MKSTPTREDAMIYLRELARHLKSYSDFGAHKQIPGPHAGRAWEFGMEMDMALDAIETQSLIALPVIDPSLLEVGK